MISSFFVDFGHSLPFFYECGSSISQSTIDHQPSQLSVIKSPSFPNPYPASVECQYRVQRTSPAVCAATFVFNMMDIDPSDQCHKDYVEINGERLCGLKTIGFSRTVSFGDGHEVLMRFVSNNGSNLVQNRKSTGFLVTVMQQECPVKGHCGDQLFTSRRFVITSPDWPKSYAANHHCRYIVARANRRVCRIRMILRTFDLEQRSHCDNDYLALADGNKICGHQPSGQVIEQIFDDRHQTMSLDFVSNGNINSDGFYIDVYQLACPLSSSQSVMSSFAGKQPRTTRIRRKMSHLKRFKSKSHYR